MTIHFIISLIIAVYLAAPAFALFVGGWLIRNDVHRAAAAARGVFYPPSRILEDLRAVQDAVVDFLAISKPAPQLLEYLGGQGAALPLRRLLATDAGDQTRGRRGWFALFVMAVTGLVRFGKRGIALTDAGREVLARLTNRAASTAIDDETPPLIAPSNREAGAPTRSAKAIGGKSHLRLVREVLDEDASAHPSTRSATPPGFAMGQLRSQPADPPPAQARAAAMVITAADHDELTSAMVAAHKLDARRGEIRALQAKIAKATIVSRADLPPDVITLNSHAELVDLDTRERLQLALVFPLEANLEAGRISVLDSLGTAMLGRRVGDQIQWPVPYRRCRLIVTDVRFQPERMLALAA